jgi:tetratricopeptide (TPR) repeat protein
MKTKMLCGFAAILIVLWAGSVLAQSLNQAIKLSNEASTIFNSAKSKEDYQRAAQKFEKALKISERLKFDKLIGLCSNNLGVIQLTLGQYQKSLEYFEKSLPITRKIGDVKVEGTTLNNIGAVYQKLGQYTNTLDYFEQSLVVFKKIGDVSGEGTTLNNIGLIYKSLGQYTKALNYYERSLALTKKTGDVKGEGTTLDNIGTIYNNLGQYTKALNYYERSLALTKKTGDVKGEGTTFNNIGLAYNNLGQYTEALNYYEQSLALTKKIGDVKGEGTTLDNIGLIHKSLGQYTKALNYYEQSLAISKKIGDVSGEGANLHNIGAVYKELGQYTKALNYYEQSLALTKKIGDVKGEGTTFNNIGAVYKSLGQYTEALDYFEQSLAISKKIGNINLEGTNLENIALVYAAMSRYEEAERRLKESIQIDKKLGVPKQGHQDLLADLYLDSGSIAEAEPLINETKYASTLGRLALIKSDYPSAQSYYENDMNLAEKTGNTDALFRSYTGLARSYEGMKDYPKAEEYYEKAVNHVEEIRSGLLPSERKNFFEVKTGGFARSDPAKGLTRVRMKLNNPDASISPGELTKARSFADHLSQATAIGATNIPSSLMEEEQSYVNQLAALKKELAKTDPEKAPDKFKNLSKSVKDAKDELNSFVDKLWQDYPAYAAVKYPRPPSLKDSALRPEECAVIFDVSSEGVGIILIRDKAVSKSFYLDLKLADLERDVIKFREPFEKLRLKEYDPELAKSLYNKLLRPALVDVPNGTPLIIIPDGILAMLPFEALVTGGAAKWNKSANGFDYPDGLTFLGDEHPISYYQSITALTLVRTIGNKEKPKDSLLVVADPVFNMKDQRAQQASETVVSQRDKEYNIQRMAAIEDVAGPLFPQLPETGKLAESLSKMYGMDCLSITGLKADKLDFLSKIAPRMDQYGSVVFATHGVMGNKVPGVMEPFLALTMVPPGTDGFLKMSDILALKMNADVVALTACQSGLGKELSGEGVMSMGRAFQYAGARSVLMSLWEVEEKSAVMLAENFFKYRKQGKTRLESLKLARDDIRNAGYKHPFFWSAFILVGEAS